MSGVTVDCGHVIRELWDWLDGQMEPARLAAIREHLAVCRGCANHVAFARGFLEHVKEPLKSNGELDILRDRVRDALEHEPS